MDSVSIAIIGTAATWIGTVVALYRLYSNRIEELDERFSKLERQLASIQSDIQWLKNSRNGFDKALDEIRERLAKLETDIEWIKQRIMD